MNALPSLCEKFQGSSAEISALILNASLSVLKTRGAVPTAKADQNHALVRRLADYVAERLTAEDVTSYEELSQLAIVLADGWPEIDRYVKTVELGSIEITVGYTSPQTGMTVHVKLSEDLMDATQNVIDAQTDKLAYMAQMALEQWLQKRNGDDSLSKPQPQRENPTENATKANQRWEAYTAIRLNIQNGARQWRVLAGNNQKYGVPIYPELLATLMPNHETMQAGDYRMRGSCVIAYKQDGKPLKVVDIKAD